jgi:phosphopantetheine adenylyltransferase
MIKGMSSLPVEAITLTSDEYISKADAQKMIEALIKETEQRVSHYANFLEKELEGDGYIIEAIRERYERHFKGVE